MTTPCGFGLAEGDLLTVRQALELVPVSKSLLYALVAAGEIASVRVGSAGSRRGRVLIARADLEAFVAGSRQAATRAPVRVDVDGLLRKVRRA